MEKKFNLRKFKPVKKTKNKKYKVCFYSNSPAIATGYAKVLREVCSRLAQDPNFDVHVIAENYIGESKPFMGFTIHGMSPEQKPEKQLNNPANFYEAFYNTYKKLQPDIVIVLEDTFTLANQGWYQWSLRDNRPCPLVVYLPLDGDNVPTTGIPILRMVDKIVSMSKFTAEAAKKDGFKSDVIYHGVDLFMFNPVTEEQKKAIRKKYGFDEDCFLIFNYGRNNLRKANQRMCEGLAKYLKDKDPKKYKAFLHIIKADVPENNIYDYWTRNIKNEYGINFLETGHVFMNPKAQDFSKTVSDAEVADYLKMSDVVISASCVAEGTKITTPDGEKTIEDIELGDMVLTDKGRYRKVVNKYVYEKDTDVSGQMFGITTYGNNEELLITDDHKLPIWRNGNIIEVNSQDLKIGDGLLYPRIKHTKSSELPILPEELKKLETTEIAKLIGLHIADGVATPEKAQIQLCVNNTTKKEIKDWYVNIVNKLGFEVKEYEQTRNRVTLQWYSKNLAKFLQDSCGHTSKNKKIPTWLMTAPEQEKQSLLQGLWADGCIRKEEITITSISFNLINQIQQLLSEFGIKSSFRKCKGRTSKLCNTASDYGELRICSIESQNKLRTILRKLPLEYDNKSKSVARFAWDRNNEYIIKPIRNIRNVVYNGLVYDLEVEEDHHYVANRNILHNSGEGFGLIMPEAGACGKPVIQTAYTTPIELLEEEVEGIGPRGITVPYDTTITSSFNTTHAFVNVDKLAEAIDKLEKDPELRKQLGNNGRKFAEYACNWNYLVEQWKDLIRKTVQ